MRKAKEVVELVNGFFNQNRENVLNDLCLRNGFENIDELSDYESHGGFGFDCGWVYITPYNREERKAWAKEQGSKYDTHILEYKLNIPYFSQSTTCKSYQIRKALKELGLDEDYWVDVRLD